MNILSISDKQGSAIDRLAKMDVRRLPHLNITHVAVHPKRPDQRDLALVAQEIEKADLIHFQYWKTAVMIRKIIPAANEKKCVLTHHNEHNIEGKQEWKDMKWDAIVVKNGWQKKALEAEGYKPELIRHAIEFDNFSYLDELPAERAVIYVGQIKKVKGVREIKQACDELGYRLIVVGLPSEADYWEALDKNNLLYLSNVPDDKLGGIYHMARAFVCNSDDGTESGTLPILEAMASGIPVVTRRIGLVRDCGEHGKNMYIRDGKYQDVEDLKSALKMVVENNDVANLIRENAWRTVRQYHPEIQAREYDKLFRRVVYPDQIPVSVIIPTFNRASVLNENLRKLTEQRYKNFEVIVGDDGSTDETKETVEAARKWAEFPIRYVNTGDTDRYGLSKARNMAAIEAIGEILVFCDDRLAMHPNALQAFVQALSGTNKRKTWLWGSKGVYKSFVENFSATWRRQFIDAGMMNERIDQYGGMGQEISGRFGAQGFDFTFCPGALAEPIVTTHSKSKHRESIISSKVKLYKMGFQ